MPPNECFESRLVPPAEESFEEYMVCNPGDILGDH
jgi:hypothetical protein